jgi:hypothetical protein
MAKKRKKKSIKIEIPLPDLPSTSEIKESVDTDEVQRIIKKNLSGAEIAKARKFAEKNYKLLLLAVVAVIAVAIAASAGPPAQYQAPSAEGPVYQTVTTDVPQVMSFDEYLVNYEGYADQGVSINGFLLNRLEQGGGTGAIGVYAYYLVDDYGNEIHLTGLTTSEKAVFVRNNVTEGLYEVTGTIKTKYGGFDLEVTSITATERPTVQVTERVLVG